MQALKTLFGFGQPAKAAATKEPAASVTVAPGLRVYAGPARLSNARHIVPTDRGFTRDAPPPLTRKHVPDELYNEHTPKDVKGYMASPHFDFLVTTFAFGQLPDYTNMWQRVMMAVLEVTEPLIRIEELRKKLINAINAANPNIRLVPSTPGEFGGTVTSEEFVYLALIRHDKRIPFALVPKGFEPHWR